MKSFDLNLKNQSSGFKSMCFLPGYNQGLIE